MVLNVDLEFNHFLKNDFSKYEEGTWVAIYKDSIISSDAVLDKVVKKVNKKSIPLSKVLLTRVRKTARYL